MKKLILILAAMTSAAPVLAHADGCLIRLRCKEIVTEYEGTYHRDDEYCQKLVDGIVGRIELRVVYRSAKGERKARTIEHWNTDAFEAVGTCEYFYKEQMKANAKARRECAAEIEDLEDQFAYCKD